MPSFIDLTGQQYGRLTVQRYAGRSKHKHSLWECRCRCGKTVVLPSGALRTGNTKSCGCLHLEQLTKAKVHGQARQHGSTPEYRAYHNAKARCTHPDIPCYKYYGGRGIKFLFTSFAEFYRCLGDKPSPRHDIDRIDVNGNYEIGNVRWVTKEESHRNMRSTKLNEVIVQEIRALSARSEITTRQLADKYGITSSTVRKVITGKLWASLPPKKPSTSVASHESKVA
jgi:hypothetical protein